MRRHFSNSYPSQSQKILRLLSGVYHNWNISHYLLAFIKNVRELSSIIFLFLPCFKSRHEITQMVMQNWYNADWCDSLNGEMGKCKTKAILTHLGIFIHIPVYSGFFRHRHNQVHSAIIQSYSEPCVTLAYSELWYIQNRGILKTRFIFRTLIYPKTLAHSELETYWELWLFRTLGYSQPQTYSEPYQKSMMDHWWTNS